MRRAAYIAVAVIAVVIGLVLALPSFLDLNDYKVEIADGVAAATGRELTLAGDIDLTLLPAPTLSVAGVSLSSIEGTRQPKLVEIGALEVRIALLPLLRRQVQVERVTLIDPVVWLEVLPSGRQNWDFSAPADAGSGTGAEEGSDAGTGLNLSFDRINIENGKVTLFDPAQDLDESISSITAEVSAGSFDGPFDLKGSLVARGIEVGIQSSIGQLRDAARVPINVSASLGGSTLAAQFSGNFSVGTGQATGTLEIQAEQAIGILAALDPGQAGNVSTIAALKKPLQAKAQIFASPGGVEINDVELQIGSSAATGAANVLFGDNLRFDVALSLSRLQLEDWLVQADSGEGSGQETGERSGDAPAGPKVVSGFEVPNNISGSIAIGIDALTYREGVVSQVDIAADLADGAIAITRAAALLPGGSSFDIRGNVSPVEGLPQFEGQVQARSDNFRALLGWLGIAVEDIASDRLRKLDFTSIVRATPELIQVYGVDMRLDSSQLSGGVAYALRDRPAFSIDFVIDQLNLDAYLPLAGAVKQDREVPKAETAGSQTPPAQAPLIPPQIASLLDGIDTNTKVSVGVITLKDVSAKGLEIDIGLLGGTLTIRKVGVKSLAGGSFALSGNARDFSSKPTLNAQLKMAASDVAGLARLAGVELPISSDRLGRIEIRGGVSGRAEKLGVDLDIAAIGGNLTLKGTVDALAPRPHFDLALTLKNKNVANIIQLFASQPQNGGLEYSGAIDARGTMAGSLDNLSVDLSTRVGDSKLGVAGSVSMSDTLSYNVTVSAEHPDAARFVNEFGADYRPAAANLGGLKLSADVSGTDKGAEVSNLEGAFGPASIAGALSLALDGPRPRVTGKLNASEILVDLFLPRPDPSSAQDASRSGSQKTTVSRWSSNPIDLSILRSADVALEITARGIIYGAYTFADPKLSLSVQEGVLSVDPLVGKLFDGDVDVRGRLSDNEIPALELAINLTDADLQRAIVDIVGLDAVAGRVGIEGSVSALGRSERELVSALNGTAMFAAQKGVIRGFDLKSLSDRLKRLNEIPDYLALLQTTLNGGETRFTTFGGTFRINDGVMTSSDLGGDLDGARLSGQTIVDLPRWLIDLKSEVRLTEHPQAPPLGLRVQGALDAPQRDVKSQKLERYLTQRVGGTLLQKILPKKARGIGSLLLGGTGKAQGTAAPRESGEEEASQQQQEQRQPQKPEPLTPESLLKGLFKGLGK